MWITSEPLKVEDAKAALKKVVKNLDHFIKKGQIEIWNYGEWYIKSGKFDAKNVLQGWVEKENQALKRGYDGLRLSGNTFWLEEKDWRNFTDYEEEVNRVIGKYRMMAICTYSLAKCGASEVIDVVSNHQFALVRREGKWVIIESSEQKQAMEAQRESEERYRTILDNIEYGYFEVDIAGNFTFFNDPLCIILGYSRDEMMGMNNRQYMDKENAKKVYQAFNRVYTTGEPYIAFDWEIVRKDGAKRFVESLVSLIRDSKGEGIGFRGIGRDITERKRGEEELQESKEFAENLIASMQEGLSVLDSDSVHIGVNAAFCQMTGFSREELIGVGLPHPYWPPEAYEEIEKSFQKTLRGEFSDIELTFMRKNGERFPVIVSPSWVKDKQGNVISYFATIKDITERKRAEEELIERGRFNFALFEHNPIQTIVVDLQGKVVKSNLAKKKSGDRLPNIGDTMYKDYAEKHEIDMYAELMKCISSGEIKEFPEQKYGDKVLSIIISPFPKGAVIICQDITERKRAEETLRYQAALLANTHDAIVASDEHYRLTTWNAAAESLYGWKAEEVLGRFGLDIIQTEYPGVDKREMLRTIAEIGHWRGEVTQARKDGTRIPVEVASIVLHDESGRITGYVSVNRDITERKRAEEVVRKSEEKYRSLTENINLGIYRNTVGPKGKFIEANPAIIRMFGYKSKEEFLAINVSNLYQNEEDRKKFNDKMLKEGFVKDEELWLRTKDGSLFFGSVSAVAVKDKQGHVKYYDGIIDNITERKWAEEALKKSEEHFRALTENASDMIIILDKKGTITYTSPSIERFSGYKPEELIGKKGFDFIKPVDLPRAIYDFGKAILARETVIPDTFRMRHKDGSERIFDGLGKNLLDNPVIAGFVMNVRDITERKRAEEERTRLLADLEAKNRELESFVYTISHDLKAPLVSLNGFSSVLQKKYESQLGEEGKHCLERIQANVAHMEALITSLLELSRIGQVVGPIEEIDVAALLRKIRDALAIRLNEAGAEFVVQEPLPTVRADRGRIHQVFANLIDNAVKFRSTERALRIEVGCRQESGFYRFHVTDNGIGIAPQFHEQIFAPFRKLHPKIEGAGIGLALVKKIVEHHGGRAWVESPSASPSTGKEGAGATFYFTLPIERGDNVSI
jgi:PAS domain S-box-containing protein